MNPVSQKLLDKAERAIAAATTMRREGDADFAANRAYYAMFYVATALLNERGLQFRKHSAAHAAFVKEFAQSSNLDPKFHRWLIDAFDKTFRGRLPVDPSRQTPKPWRK